MGTPEALFMIGLGIFMVSQLMINREVRKACQEMEARINELEALLLDKSLSKLEKSITDFCATPLKMGTPKQT